MKTETKFGGGVRATMLRTIRLVGLIAVAGFSANPTTAFAQSPPQEAAKAFEYLATLPAEQRLAIIEREAKREGSVVVYGALAIDRTRLFLKPFEDKYGIKAEFVRLTDADLPEKVLLEQRTGRVNVDVTLSGLHTQALLSDALAPYQPTTWNDFDPRFRSGSREQGWFAITYDVLPHAIAWRTDRVPSDVAPKTLDSVADPKWKGRVGTTRHLEAFIDAMIELYGEKEAQEKTRRLAALNNRLYQSVAALSEALAAGEIDIAWGIGAFRAIQLKSSKAPVDFVLPDQLTAVGIIVGIARGAKHPYAAALLTEYLTRADTLENLDKAEPGQLFGNRKGTFSTTLTQFKQLAIQKPIPVDRWKTLNREVEQLFIRN